MASLTSSPAPVEEHLLVTGATGFVGRELLRQLLDERPGTLITALVRAKSEDALEVRRRRVLKDREDDGRLRFVRADLTEPKLGLERAAYDRLVATVNQVIHGAASVRFDMEEADARAINVDGTRRVFELAEASGVRTDYISTAFVCGERQGLCREEELDVGQAHRNAYERSKLEAERLARERMKAQPIAVHRPSIIVGDSRTGRTNTFNALYWPIKVYARGIWRMCPADPMAPVDVVPVDYVARAILHLSKEESAVGRTFHLCTGAEARADPRRGGLHVQRLLRAPAADPRPPTIYYPLIRRPLERLSVGKLRKILNAGIVYAPYFEMAMRFDTTEADAALAPAGIRSPDPRSFFQQIFRFAKDTDFGSHAPRD